MALADPSAGQPVVATWGQAVFDAIVGGTSFPGVPASGDHFYRSDLGMRFYHDGTRWLSEQLFVMPTNIYDDAALSATDTFQALAPCPTLSGGSDIWLVNTVTQFLVGAGTALSGSHKWVGAFTKQPTGATDTAVATVTIDSGSSSVRRTSDQAIGALLNNGTTHYAFAWSWTKTGTPGNLYHRSYVTYRIVAT